MSKGRWQSGEEMLGQILDIGNYLNEKKVELGRGAFGKWLRSPEGPPCSPRTARLYMQITREVDRSLVLAELGHVDTLPLPTTLRAFAAEVRTQRGRVRKAIGADSAIPLPAARA